MILTFTPTQFEALAFSWLAAITVVVPVLFVTLRLILAEWRTLNAGNKEVTAQVAKLNERTDNISTSINGLMTDRITAGANAAIQADKQKANVPPHA